LPTLSRVLLLRLLPFGLLALLGTGFFSFLLERSAQSVRVREEVKKHSLLVARLADEPSLRGCLGKTFSLLLVSRPELAHVRAESSDGTVLAWAGDEQEARSWFDRTYKLAGAPVRVRLGYREEARTFSLVLRVGTWVAAATFFTLLVFWVFLSLLGRQVAAPLRELERWTRGDAPRPRLRSEELERFAELLAGRKGEGR
jgi:hypothetical protein